MATASPGSAPGAVGWLVGEENQRPRLHVHDDEQCPPCGRHAGRRRRGSRDPEGDRLSPTSAGRARRRAIPATGMAPIVHHPDVQRMLLTMKALTQGRPRHLLCLRPCDRHGACARRRRSAHWQERANLLTPIAKAFSTDVGVEVASLGVQVHGGMGFIEETGAARTLPRRAHRADLRGHQRHPGDRSRDAQAAASRTASTCTATSPSLARASRRSRTSNLRRLRRTPPSDWTRRSTTCRRRRGIFRTLLAGGQTEQALAGATPYLRLFALAAGGAYLARGALADRSARAHRALPLLRRKPARRDRARCKRPVIGGSESLARGRQRR